MATAQQLLNEIRTLVSQITNEHDVYKCKELIDEFIEKYEIWPSLAQVLASLAPKRASDKKHLLILEKKALKEIQRTYKQLSKVCESKKIIIPESITDAYEQKTLSSLGYTVSRFFAIRDLLLFISNHGETSLIQKYAILGPTGDIYECIFSPAYIQWSEEKELARKSAWYCFDQIMYLKNTSKFTLIEDSPLEDNEPHRVLQALQAVMSPLEPQNALTQYKMCAKTLYDYAKTVLLGKEQQPDSYDKGTGILVKNGTKTRFKPMQLRGRILNLLHPSGKPRGGALPFDEIYDQVIKSSTDKDWFNLDKASREKFKKQIFEAYEGINEQVVKKAKIPLLVAKDLNLHFA